MKEAASPKTVENNKPLPETSEGHAQEWLDTRRERAYAAVIGEIRTALEQGMRAGDFLKKVVEFGAPYNRREIPERFKSLTPEELEAIQCVLVTSEYASKIAGADIARPMFIVNDSKVYGKIEEVIGLQPGESHGLTLPETFFNGLPNWKDVHVMITQNHEPTVVHEIQHSMDPLIGKRTGYDRMIAEIFAYISEERTGGRANWQDMSRRVANPAYFKRYSSALPDKERINLEEWADTVSRAVGKVQQLVESSGEISAMRQLATVRTLDELFEIQPAPAGQPAEIITSKETRATEHGAT